MTILWSKDREKFQQSDAMSICFSYKCHCSPNDRDIKGAKRDFHHSAPLLRVLLLLAMLIWVTLILLVIKESLVELL